MQMILTPAFIRRAALARSSPNSRSSSAISLPGTECRENLFVFGESDVTSHRARLNSIDTNIAASSTELDKLGSRLQTLASMINSSIALLANTGSIAGGNPHGILSPRLRARPGQGRPAARQGQPASGAPLRGGHRQARQDRSPRRGAARPHG